ncbi:MAG TPA: hypothetical protein VGL71_07335, partial [Urbifossiella sp.]
MNLSSSLNRIVTIGTGRFLKKVRRRMRLFLGGEHPRHYFDLDDRDLIARIMAANSLPPPEGSPREAAGREGDLVRGETLFELREDLRREIPFALTPAQRGEFFRWFCRYGNGANGITPQDILRMLFEQDVAPDRGLVASYLVHPAWQKQYPDALTPAGWEPFKRGLAAEHGLRGRWLRRARLPKQHCEQKPLPPGEIGVNALGLFRYRSGLQQAAQSVIEALAAAGVRLSIRDIPMSHNRDGRPRAGFDGLERFPITLINTGLDLPIPEAYRNAGLHPRTGVYRIAIWWWELEQLPREWLHRGADVDEIWAPTTFIASALRVLGKPVYPMLPSVRLPAFLAKPKAALGLSTEKFTFLFVFDMNSRMPR